MLPLSHNDQYNKGADSVVSEKYIRQFYPNFKLIYLALSTTSMMLMLKISNALPISLSMLYLPSRDFCCELCLSLRIEITHILEL
jgi:hypothetical protein